MIKYHKIKLLNQEIATKFNPIKIGLFGSYANGKNTEDSDVDILVILPFEKYPFRKAAEMLNATNPDFPVDLLARTPA
jgi:predicted nucleotidyltransferase